MARKQKKRGTPESSAFPVGTVIETRGVTGTVRQGEIRAVLGQAPLERYRVRWHDQHESIIDATDDVVVKG